MKVEKGIADGGKKNGIRLEGIVEFKGDLKGGGGEGDVVRRRIPCTVVIAGTIHNDVVVVRNGEIKKIIIYP